MTTGSDDVRAVRHPIRGQSHAIRTTSGAGAAEHVAVAHVTVDLERGRAPTVDTMTTQTLAASVPAELDGFWDVARVGTLGTVRADGSPHLVPVKVLRDGDDFLVLTRARTVKVRNVLAHPAISLAEHTATTWATVEGRAEVSTDPDELARARAAYRRRFGEPDHAADCVLVVRPTRVLLGR